MFYELKRAIEAVETKPPSINPFPVSFGGDRPWFVDVALAQLIEDEWPTLKPKLLQRLKDAASEWDTDGYHIGKKV